jgi:hypothetical protein
MKRRKMILNKWLIGYKQLVKLMIRNKSWKKYEFNLIWVGYNFSSTNGGQEASPRCPHDKGVGIRVST